LTAAASMFQTVFHGGTRKVDHNRAGTVYICLFKSQTVGRTYKEELKNLCIKMCQGNF